MANRLATSLSPYLRQHAGNPVHWQEWGPEAFAEANHRDCPIVLSVGYAACHWCHVMAHESFESPLVAEVLNDRFVAIKVDREERPDVDAIYMAATTALTGRGGWPMTVLMAPSGTPFWAGTYLPRAQFLALLDAAADAWASRRDEVASAGDTILAAMTAAVSPQPAVPIDRHTLAGAVEALGAVFDRRHGGFGRAPKFPPSMALAFLLRHSARTGSVEAMEMVTQTCEAMAYGGMYDQVGGGFARYSVDADWVVPHFEKMLYDNALLLRVYLHWWRLTGSPLARRVVRETAEFLLAELHTPEGGFAAALDADSDGAEGLFYAWTPAQLEEALGPDDAAWAAALLSVTAAGTFEHGMSTLQLRHDPDDERRWERIRADLHRARAMRPHPGRDDKVVASWNGLAIAALAEAGALLDEPGWVEAAIGAADLIIAVHLGAHDDDRLCRTSRDGRAGSSEGVLDDYGGVAEGFLALYQVTGDEVWIVFAGMCIDISIQHFADGRGGFYDTADDAPALIQRPRDPSDNAEPSGWFAVANACITYAALTGLTEYRDVAERALGVVTPLVGPAARAVGWGLVAAAALAAGPLEVAVVGRVGDPALAAMRRMALMATSPGAVVAVGFDGVETDADDGVPLLRARTARDGRATAYVCRGFVCDAPVTDMAELAIRVGSRSEPGEE